MHSDHMWVVAQNTGREGHLGMRASAAQPRLMQCMRQSSLWSTWQLVPLQICIDNGACALLIQGGQLDDAEGLISENNMNALNDNPSPHSVCRVPSLLYAIQQNYTQA